MVKKLDKKLKPKTTKRTESPHKTFRLTKRRDAARSLGLPGFLRFTKNVFDTMWKYKKIYVILLIIFTISFIAIGRMVSSETYNALVGVVTSNSQEEQGITGLTSLEQAGILLSSLISGVSSDDTAVQIVGLIIGLLLWLVVVWLLRHLFAGNSVRVRDAFYSAGGPIVGTFVLGCVLLIQALPAAIGALLYNTARTTLDINNGVIAMMAAIILGGLILLSLYFAIATLFAAIIVTLPGTYPLQALKSASKIVMGRRTGLVLRFIWMVLVVTIVWLLIGIPVVLLDLWLKSTFEAISWLPFVPFVAVILSVSSALFASTYIYMLYRKVVDHDASEQ